MARLHRRLFRGSFVAFLVTMVCLVPIVISPASVAAQQSPTGTKGGANAGSDSGSGGNADASSANQKIVQPSVQEVVADFDLVWQSINDEYYDPKFNGVDWAKAKTDYRTKIENAKDGEAAYKLITELLDSLKDPGTGVLPPWLVPTPQSNSSDVQMQYGGVGMLLGQAKSGDVTVLNVFDGTPAQKAGVLVGDVIIKVDDWQVTGSDPLQEVTNRARGQVGTNLSMTLRDPAGKERSVTMTRAKIDLNPKVESRTIQGSIGYLRIPVLNQQMVDDASKALPALLSTQYLILDLRGVSAGGVDPMLTVARWFLGAAHMGGFVARQGAQELPFQNSAIAAYQRPIAVITDSTTYGVGEILADLMQTYSRGKLIGAKTAGGFEIGKYVNLPSGGLLQFTVARYVSPQGDPLPLGGLSPDVEVAEPDLATIRAGKDPYVDKAIEVLRSGVR